MQKSQGNKKGLNYFMRLSSPMTVKYHCLEAICASENLCITAYQEPRMHICRSVFQFLLYMLGPLCDTWQMDLMSNSLVFPNVFFAKLPLLSQIFC